jgi:WD40 repeat protein
VWALAFSPDGRTLATTSFDETVRLWDVATGTLRATAHTAAVTKLVFSPDGKTLATGSRDNTARIWDVTSGSLKATLQGHASTVVAITFSPDGRTLATGSVDGEVRLRDTATGALKATLRAHTAAVTNLALSPDGKTLATQSRDNTARVWDVASGALKASLQGYRYAPGSLLSFSPQGTTLAIGSPEGAVDRWDVATGSLKATLQGRTGRLWALAFSPDGTTLATGNQAGTAQLWDAAAGTLKATLKGHGWPSWLDLAFSHNGRMLAIATDPWTVRLWDLVTGTLKTTFRSHDAGMSGLAFSPDGRTVATGSDDGRARLWDSGSGTVKATLKGDIRSFSSALAFSPDGRTLATGSYDKTVQLWDVGSGTLKGTLKGQIDRPSALAFSPDGRTVATGSDDGSARLWDSGSGALKATLQGHTRGVWALAFSPNGRMLATASPEIDGAVRLWDVGAGTLKGTIAGHTSNVYRLAFSPDGKRLATGSFDKKTAQLWDVTTGRPIPLTRLAQLAPFPEVAHPWSDAGAALSLHDPRDGRVLATLLPMPDAEGQAESTAARPIEVVAKAIPARPAGEWFVTIPEGYFDCSANAARFVKWKVGSAVIPAERYLRRFRRPDLVRRALAGERITAPAISNDDLPPVVSVPYLKDGDTATANPLPVSLEVRSVTAVKEVELLVNGRPLPPERAKPIEVIAKPIEVVAKGADPRYRLVTRFAFRVPLPQGAAEVGLRAVAYDRTGLGSDPVRLALKRPGAQPVAGNLYVLAVGVSRYRNGKRPGAGGKGQFANLRYPADDAKAVAERFRREGAPLYGRVEVRTLVDEQATVAKLREEFRWLQRSVRPGQVDTVVVFLSGHGVSTEEGRYYFATHEIDVSSVEALAGTSLSGRELAAELGGKLRAKSVFLFVDTCHAGGLRGRSSDLKAEVASGGVYLMASSGEKEVSYESAEWGHGAFTLALLKALAKPELARDGVIHFNALTYAVPDEVAAALKAAGRSESEQEVCVPLELRRLREPVAQVRR